MRSLNYKTAGFTLLMIPFLASGASTSQRKHEKSVPRTVWNFDGGVIFETDGNAPGGTCFRLSGRLTAPQFFDELKRIDDNSGTLYLHGTQSVTEFPDQVMLTFVIRDFPCPSQLQVTGSRTYLTQALLNAMSLSLYWKRGIELRPVEKLSDARFYVKRVVPYAAETATQLPERFEWFYRMNIPSAGVPLTDDLVVLLRNPDGRIAARVAARL
jgi:hypothetical protein